MEQRKTPANLGEQRDTQGPAGAVGRPPSEPRVLSDDQCLRQWSSGGEEKNTCPFTAGGSWVASAGAGSGRK